MQVQADIFSPASSSLDLLIQNILELEARPKVALEDKRAELSQLDSVLSDLDSKLSALHTLAKRLTDPITDYFATKSATSSDEEFFTASAGSTALAGSHDITIQRLASADTRVSKQYSATGTDLSSFFSTNGSQTFQIEVAHPTTADSTNRVNISVTVNPTSSGNKDVLNEIAVAINNAMNNAVTAGTITSEEKVTASVVQEDSTNARLVLKSGKSGYTYRLGFTDSANSLLSTLEVSNNVQTSGTSGGYVTAIGTSATNSSLNAKLQVDGLTFYRDSNEITDILTGVTLNLKNVTTGTETLQVATDVEAVKQEVDDFLAAYNDVLHFLKEKTSVDPDTSVRAPLAASSTYRELISRLRNVMTAKVTNVISGNPEYLSEIGITAAADGSLSITDTDKFENALNTSTNQISDLFNVTDGVATQIKDLVNDYIKVGGFIDDSQNSISDRIKILDDRIARLDKQLSLREFQLRQQFSKMQELSATLQLQQAALQSLMGG